MSGDPAAVDAVDVFTDRLANIDLGVEQILRDTETFPDTPMVQLGAAMVWLYGQTHDATNQARGHLDGAATLEPAMNERERATLAALRLWLSDDYLAAATTFEELVKQWPRDLLALKALEFIYYVLGQQHYGQRFLAQVESISEPNGGDPDFLAVWAFASELSGHPDRANELAERAVDLRHDTPWAHHALAHVYITRGDADGERERLIGFLPSWERSGRVIYCHNAWHLAVAMLDSLDAESARSIYVDHVWNVQPDTPGEQIDAVSLLWRLEMAGFAVAPEQWNDIADHVEQRVDECFMPFLSAHHAYALARADRSEALDRLFATVHHRAGENDAEAERVWRPTGVPVIEACAAHARGDFSRSAELLDSVMPEMTAVGGSDAQTDVFRQTYLTSLSGAGRHDDAKRYWETMTSWKSARSPLDDRLRERL
jgi:tetratricopeptide (TPR) repeat protein